MTSTPDYQQPPQAWGGYQEPPAWSGYQQPPQAWSDYQQPPQAWGPPPQQPMVKHRKVVSMRTFIGLGALTAAAAASVAPFLRFWMQRYSDTQPGPRNARLVINGFGRYTYHRASDQVHGHDTNYGVPLVMAALVLAIAAIVLVAHKGDVVTPMLLAVIGGSMLGALAVEGAVDRGARSSYDDKYTQWSVGYGWWLMTFAGGLGAILAVTATAVVFKSRRVVSSVQVGK